jgi:hypothetical protein
MYLKMCIFQHRMLCSLLKSTNLSEEHATFQQTMYTWHDIPEDALFIITAVRTSNSLLSFIRHFFFPRNF